MTAPVVEPGTRRRHRTESLPPYHVVLVNDDDHSVHYVIWMLGELFGHPPEKGAKMAKEVHTAGRVIVATTNLEEAELKREQIQSFGPALQGLDVGYRGACNGLILTTIHKLEVAMLRKRLKR